MMELSQYAAERRSHLLGSGSLISRNFLSFVSTFVLFKNALKGSELTPPNDMMISKNEFETT